jgi:hypothetical protein
MSKMCLRAEIFLFRNMWKLLFQDQSKYEGLGLKSLKNGIELFFLNSSSNVAFYSLFDASFKHFREKYYCEYI